MSQELRTLIQSFVKGSDEETNRELRYLVQCLARSFDEEDNRAHDLWSWLPSYKIAEKYHGDYASNHMPSIAAILEEAAFVLSEHAGYQHTPAERAEFLQCPCGEGCELELPKDEEERSE